MTAVDVWVLRPADCAAGADLSLILSEVELRRRDELRRTDDRMRFVAGAALLRVVAGDAIGIAPQQVPVIRRCRWCAGPHGRPTVDGAPSLSLSHAGDLVVLAGCRSGTAGIDLEPSGREVGTAVASMVLSREEYGNHAGGDDLLRYWVRKEAVLKALDVGLSVAMTDLTVSPPTEPAALLGHRLDVDAPIAMADVPVPGALATVAVVGASTLEVTTRDAAGLFGSPQDR